MKVEGYLMDKHVVEVVGEATGEGVPQVTEQVLLLLHCQQFVMACHRKKTDRGELENCTPNEVALYLVF